ncbi:UvrD-helicase domain-containing protein [Ramlibacter sp. AN1133]|uniref:UvrD-helicase domain-containing protein n=1 Tax=Ramlibacter sp. AN1133 TaxID=3133429 RepID=UPI0030BE584C
MRAKPTVTYTDEQQAIIDCDARVVVADAKAGTGKTTTGIGFAKRRPHASLLYMAYNKSLQLEATQRFGENTECRTTHSLAFQAVGKHYSHRVSFNWRALNVRNELNLSNIRAAAIAQSVLIAFFQSTASEITLEHAGEAELKFHASEHEMAAGVLDAKVLWRRMQDRSDTVTMSPDAYLKMWALTNPRLNYDFIICDEWQDANPVTAHIVEQQRHARLLVLGDPHQSIYAFRGAINAMEQFPGATRLHLSKTWRFGPKVAQVANLVLSELKKEQVLIKGMGEDIPYRSGAPVTRLARTNAQLFKEAVLLEGRGVHWVGGVEKYKFDRILDAYYLFANQRERINDPFLRYFTSYGDMVAYATESKDPETKILAQVIDEYRHDTPRLVQLVKTNAVKDQPDAQLTLSTGHGAKGLDFDYVQLADDFEILQECETMLVADPFAQLPHQELNLLYVALTRAKKEIALNADTRQWLQNLPRHRRDRAEALERARARQEPFPTHAA